MRIKRLAAAAAVATLTVLGAPAFAGIAQAGVVAPRDVTDGPFDQGVLAGQTATFTATDDDCDDSCDQQWLVSTDGGNSFAPIAGATSETYSFTAALSENGYEFESQFSEAQDEDDAATPADEVVVATTSAATLTVDELPTITKQPSDLHACNGCTAKFTAIAIGQPAPTVEWQYSADEGNTWGDAGEGIPGIEAIPNGIMFRVRSFEDGYLFRAVFSNDAGPEPQQPKHADVARPDDIGGIATATTRSASLQVFDVHPPTTVTTGTSTPKTYNAAGTAPAATAAPGSILPVTGEPIGWELGAATGLLMTGAGLQLGNRRRRRTARNIRVINSIAL